MDGPYVLSKNVNNKKNDSSFVVLLILMQNHPNFVPPFENSTTHIAITVIQNIFTILLN